MARLEKPKGLTINFRPSERQLELWNVLQPNRCDKCGHKLVLKPNGYDKNGHQVYIPTCSHCGNTDIPEQILGGGSAGGGKSFIGCCWLTLSCMQFEGIRMVVARKVRKTLLETTWNTLKDVLRLWGLKQDVHYHINNLAYTITFWNGSEILAMDLTPSPGDPDFNSLGSLEITGGFIDEVSEVSEKAVEVLASRIRYKVSETFVAGKLFMSTNPCLTWVRSTFVMTDDGDHVTLPKGYRYIPFSLFDNPNEQFRAIYYNKLIKLRNKADRDRLLYGNWLFTTSNKMAAYWNFDGDKHLIQNLKESAYDPMKPLILSFDFNVNPYMSCLPMQIDFSEKVINIFPEYVGYPKDKHNNTPAFTRRIASQLVCDGHIGVS